MTNLKNYGRVFYGIGIAGIGILHFFFLGFRPIILPVPAASVANISFIAHLVGLYFFLSGIFISIGKNVRNTSLLLGAILFMFFLFGHLPVRIQSGNPWIDAIKIVALSGGGFLLASAYPKAERSKFFEKLITISPAGKYLFAIMLCTFGFGHLANAERVSGLVPKYIPWSLFWTYLAGLALVGSGLSFFINFRVRFIGLLLSIILFLWLILLHIYYAVRFPAFQDGENIIGCFECLAFCGTALIISWLGQVKEEKQIV
jgi:uncharacterized membrane protein